MAQIPTAEELLIEEIKKFSSPLTSKSLQLLVNNVATEFAKMHVEAALKEASEKSGLNMISTTTFGKNYRQEILNSYSLDNIK